MNKLLIGIFILLLLLAVGSGIGSGVWVRDKAQNWALSSRILGGTLPQEWCAAHGARWYMSAPWDAAWPGRPCGTGPYHRHATVALLLPRLR